jgi:hypothetical protein
MSTESLRRKVDEIKAACGAARGPKHVIWLPEGAAELAELRRNGVSEGDIMAVQWLDPGTPEPKHKD